MYWIGESAKEGLVQERTDELECAIEELRAINEDVHEKNQMINEQNQELQTALHNNNRWIS